MSTGAKAGAAAGAKTGAAPPKASSSFGPAAKAESKTAAVVAGLPFASKELIRGQKTEPAETFHGLVSPALETNEDLQAQSKDALLSKDWNALERLSRQRLELVPDSIMALKLLGQAQYERGLAALDARRFNEAEKLLLESLQFHLEHTGPTSDSSGRCLLQLGRAAAGNASRKLAMERISNAREIFIQAGLSASVAECDAELAKLHN